MPKFTSRKSHLSIPWQPMENSDGLWCVTTSPYDLAQWGVNSIIPEGFTSDGMSIPRFFWRWLGPRIDTNTVGPSIAHDWFYFSHALSRKDADLWFYEALKHNGYSAIKAKAVYAGLRLFGWTHW